MATKKTACTYCDGAGKVDKNGNPPPAGTPVFDCPICKGTGLKPKAKKR